MHSFADKIHRKDLFHLFQEYAQVEQSSRQNDDLFFAKIQIDWVQSDSVYIMNIRKGWINDFLICFFQFPDFGYSSEKKFSAHHKFKDPNKLPPKINFILKEKVTYEELETDPPITIVSVPTEMEP